MCDAISFYNNHRTEREPVTNKLHIAASASNIAYNLSPRASPPKSNSHYDENGNGDISYLLSTIFKLRPPRYYSPEKKNMSNAHFLNMQFAELIEKIKIRHDPVVPTTAQAVHDLRKQNLMNVRGPEVQAFLNRFHLSRIGIRMLIGQHIALSKPLPDQNYIGIINPRTNIIEVCEDAIADASNVCIGHYGFTPTVSIDCEENISFLFVPSHLHHILFEILKNSMRAVIEAGREDEENAITIIIRPEKSVSTSFIYDSARIDTDIVSLENPCKGRRQGRRYQAGKSQSYLDVHVYDSRLRT